MTALQMNSNDGEQDLLNHGFHGWTRMDPFGIPRTPRLENDLFEVNQWEELRTDDAR